MSAHHSIATRGIQTRQGHTALMVATARELARLRCWACAAVRRTIWTHGGFCPGCGRGEWERPCA